MRNTVRVLCLSALVAAAGCTDRRGNVNWGETALLGVAAGGITALGAGALADRARPRGYRGGYGRPAYNRGGYPPPIAGDGYHDRGYGGYGGHRGWGF